MSILVEDSPRNLLKWIRDAMDAGTASGAVTNPFASPSGPGHPRRSVVDVMSEMQARNAVRFFDATTHALYSPTVADFRYYDGYNLWAGARGDLSTSGSIADHVSRVFEWQRTLNAPFLAPTALVRSPLGSDATVALSLAAEAKAQQNNTWLTIAGDEQFWSSGSQLDAHIGSIAQFQPDGWFLVSVRSTGVVPVPILRQEVDGFARTVNSLSRDAKVHVSHGDLAGLPGIAAGATTLGTGWDQRQMNFGTVHYGPRDTSDNGFGSWFKRPTIGGILSRIKESEYESLIQRSSTLATRVVPSRIAPLSVENIFLHHVARLAFAAQQIQSAPTPEDRYKVLRDLYLAAKNDWPSVKAAGITELDSSHWIDELQAGLELYARGEGW